MSFRSERMTGLARLRSRLPTRPRSFKQFTGLFEFAYGEPAFSSPPHCKTKRTPKRCPFISERMTRSLGCAPACRHAHGLSNSSPDYLNLPYGEPTFSSPYLIIKNKRHRIGVFYFLERMTRSLGCAPACRHAHGLSNNSPDCLNSPTANRPFRVPISL